MYPERSRYRGRQERDGSRELPGKQTAAVKGIFITWAGGSRRFFLVVALAVSHLWEIPQSKRVGEMFT